MESWETRWRKAKGKRGVSPIIATILLVAITVVLAAVLYILVSGYIGGTGSKPLSLGMAGEQAATSPNGKVFYANFSLSPSSGLTTSDFGLKITNPAGSVVTGWTATLVSSTGTALGTFPAGASAWSGTSGTVTVNASDTLSISDSVQLAGTGDTLTAFGIGGASVSGSATM